MNNYDVKLPNYTCYRGRKQATTKLYLTSWSWILSLLEFNFTRVRQSKWVGIIAIKTEGTKIHFLSDVFAAIASLDLKDWKVKTAKYKLLNWKLITRRSIRCNWWVNRWNNLACLNLSSFLPLQLTKSFSFSFICLSFSEISFPTKVYYMLLCVKNVMDVLL